MSFRQTNGNLSNNNLQPISPPLPPRPRPNYAGFNSGMGDPLFTSYGSNNYFNSYPGYSPYSNPFNNFNSSMNQQPANSFLRAAEDNSRNAFQSIQSVVQAFSAVSAMFESTFHAVYNSFRAVVGVADQFYRLKQNLSNIVSAFAVFRALKYLYHKLLRILRLQKADKTDQIWNNVSSLTDAEILVKDARKPQTNWPLVMFFAGIILFHCSIF
jgi:peroxin-13